MSIRWKLVLTYLGVALLVPILGYVATRRADVVQGDAGALNRGALPMLSAVKELEEAHGAQASAALTYVAGGSVQARHLADDGATRFDHVLTRLDSATAGSHGDDHTAIAQIVAKLKDEQTKYDAAVGQVLGARDSIDRNLGDLRTRNDELVQDLNAVRRRNGGADLASGGAALTARRENADLLLAVEGMHHVVDLETALATAYVVHQDAVIRRQFESAGLTFTGWLQLANAVAGGEDRQTLARVQTRFLKEFEPSARSTIVAADVTGKAAAVFDEADRAMTTLLAETAVEAANRTEQAGGTVEAAADRAGTLTLLMTAVGFALAGALGLWFARTITRPLIQLRNVAERVSQGDLASVDIEVRSNDELGDLARAIRRMIVSLRIVMSGAAEADAGLPGSR